MTAEKSKGLFAKIADAIRNVFCPDQTSEQFAVNIRDFIKGLVMATFTAPVTIIGQSVEAGKFDFDFAMIWRVALAAMFAYVLKRFLTAPPKPEEKK